MGVATKPNGTSPISLKAGIRLLLSRPATTIIRPGAPLPSATEPWNLVYFHHPPYSSGAVHGSSPWMQWPFPAWGASAILSGHDHEYERIVVSGFPYFVNGLGGESIYSFGAPVSG